MEVLRPGPSAQEVYASPSKPSGTRTGQEKTDTLLLDQAVHLVQQVGHPLDFVDDDRAVRWREFLADTSGILADSQIGRRIQKVIDFNVLEAVADQEGFAGLTRPQEKMGLLRQETGKVQGPFDNRGDVPKIIVRHIHRHLTYQMTTRLSIRNRPL
jgi:hypothetical protein